MKVKFFGGLAWIQKKGRAAREVPGRGREKGCIWAGKWDNNPFGSRHSPLVISITYPLFR